MHNSTIDDLIRKKGLLDKVAVRDAECCLTYAELDLEVDKVSARLVEQGMLPQNVIGIIAVNAVTTVVAILAIARAGGVFVPISPKLPNGMLEKILVDATCTHLLADLRFDRSGALLHRTLETQVIRTDGRVLDLASTRLRRLAGDLSPPIHGMDPKLAAIFYTSGSSGEPKGIRVSHANLLVGAESVNAYLKNKPTDVLLGVLPLSFDAGFSQITTGLMVGSEIVLISYLFPADVANAAERYGVTAITGVPHLLLQISRVSWSDRSRAKIRYIASTGGRLTSSMLRRLQKQFPNAQPYLMYGLTEAFRSTYLNPNDLPGHEHSIGKPIPNAEILVMGQDGRECPPGVKGELVHVGPLVAQGYWRQHADSERGYARFEDAPAASRLGGRCVWSGDVVSRDTDGFLYFHGRRDQNVKISGHRVNPSEIEELLSASNWIIESCVVPFESPSGLQQLGVVLVVEEDVAESTLTSRFTKELLDYQILIPTYALPSRILVVRSLPATPNGKVDRGACAHLIEAHPEVEQEATTR